MLSESWLSPLGTVISDFLSMKRAVGHPYMSGAIILHQLDKWVSAHYPEDTTLSQTIIEEWLSTIPGEHPNRYHRKVTVLRQLATFMCSLGIPAYVLPSGFLSREKKYRAHVYSNEDLVAFFQAIDLCPTSPFSPYRHLVIPLVFRFLYCCGMRSSEVRLLHVDDIDLITGRLIIRESKGWKTRVIYLAEDLLQLCRIYDVNIRKPLPRRVAFFPNKDGQCYSKSTFDVWFHEFWDPIMAEKPVIGNRPRVHDFRHTFAVHRLNAWVQNGDDTNALLIYLSEYLGHAHFADTDYYLTLVESFYPEMEDSVL